MTEPHKAMRALVARTIVPHGASLALILVLQLACGVLMAVQPRYYQQLVSLVAGGVHAAPWMQGVPLLAQLAGIYLVIALLQGTTGYCGSSFSYRLQKQLQTDFFEQTTHLPLEYFQKQSAGEFFTRFNNDIGQAQRFFADLLPGVLRELITALVVTFVLFCFCPALLVMAALGIVGLSAVLVALLNGIMGRYAQAQRAGWSGVHKVFDETVQGIDTLKTQGAEDWQGRQFERQTTALQRTSMKAGTVLSVFSPGIELISRLGGLALLVVAYYLIATGAMDLDSFLLFFFYATLLQMSIAELTRMLATAQNELTGLRHLADFFAESAEIEEAHSLLKMPARSMAIELLRVTFGYPGGRRLYRDASVTIPARAVTLVHGESGSGKSTLINLVLRFHAVERGAISIGGTDIRRLSRAELRKRIGVVTQQHFVFEGSLRTNLLIARPDAPDQEILQAFERAQLCEFLARLRHGLDTIMDPRGKGISAGERQRISIARLLLRGAPIMILDEPWSHLDLKSRGALVEVVNGCRDNTTILILSHERHPALAVDCVYRLDGARGTFVKESGSSENGLDGKGALIAGAS